MDIGRINETNPNSLNRPKNEREVQHDNTFQKEVDFDDAFRAAGTVGQSMVKPPSKEISKYEILLNKILSNKGKALTNEEADEYLRNAGYEDEQIAAYRKAMNDDEAYNTLVRCVSLIPETTKSIEVKENEDPFKGLNREIFDFINKENIALIMKEMGYNENDALDALPSIITTVLESKEVPTQKLVNMFEMAEAAGVPLDLIIKKINSSENPELFTKERVAAFSNLMNAIDEPIHLDMIDCIKDPKAITPEFIEEYKKTFEKIKTNNIVNVYKSGLSESEEFVAELYREPVYALQTYKNLLQKMEEYGLDFSWYKGKNYRHPSSIPIYYVQNLINSEKIKQISEMIKNTGDKFKDKYDYVLYDSLKEDICLDDVENYTKLLNTIAEIPCINNAFGKLVESIKYTKPKDFSGAIKVAEAFKEVEAYPASTGGYPLFSSPENPELAANLIHGLKDFYENSEEYTINDYMQEPWRGMYYDQSEHKFQVLTENGLKGKIIPNDLRHILESDGDEVLNKVILFNENPVFKGSAHLFSKFSDESLKQVFDELDEIVKKENPEFSHLTPHEIEKIIDNIPLGMCTNIYNKLQFGNKLNPEDFRISNVIKKDLYEFVELLYVKNDKKFKSLEKTGLSINFKNYQKGESEIRDKEFNYVIELLKSDLPAKVIQKRIGLKMINNKEAELLDQLLEDAYANRDLLKSGQHDLTDDDIVGAINTPSTVKALRILGKGNLESAFPATIEGFKDICSEMNDFSPSKENREKLLQKINPTESQKYESYTQKIKELKSKFKELKDSPNGFDKNSEEVKKLMNEINTQSRELNAFLKEYSGLKPQEILDKVRVLAVIDKATNGKETARFIDLLKPSTQENDEVWYQEVNKMIYELIGVESDDILNQKLDLINSKYLTKLAISLADGIDDDGFLTRNSDFCKYMKNLVQLIKDNPDKTVEEAIDNLPQNIITKGKYKNLGIDYEKWTKVNPESYSSIEIELSAEEAQKAAISNVEKDLSNPLFEDIPKEAKNELLDALKGIGVTLESQKEYIFDHNGFNQGEYIMTNKLYKDGKPIKFDDMKKVISCIKDAINANQFWTTKQEDPAVEHARTEIYEHLIKLRKAEIGSAKSIKGDEKVKMKVSKTNMYDIKKAIGLGNDAQCCTALGGIFNEYSAPTYIMNKCIGAIELTDNGKFVGNTMIYLAEVDGVPSLVLDNVELKAKYQKNDSIRDTFIDYAKKLCEEIGKPDMPIYAGPNRHKLDFDIFPKSKREMKVIGSTGKDKIYLDFDAQPHIIDQEGPARVDLYKLR